MKTSAIQDEHATKTGERAEKLERKPERLEPSRRTLWFLFAIAFFSSALMSLVVYGSTVPFWEKAIFDVVNGVDVPLFLEVIARILSDIVWLAVFLVAASLFVRKYFRAAWRIAAVGGGSYVFVYIIEHIIQRGRPEALYGSSEFVLRATQDGYGFPSGHVGTISGILLALWPVMTWPFRIVALGLIIGVMWSRIFLGVHMPLDVFAGFTSALIVYAVLALLPTVIRKKLLLT